jgi:hypothetical protein
VAPKFAFGIRNLHKHKRLVDRQVINLHTQVTPVLWRLGWAAFGRAGCRLCTGIANPAQSPPVNCGQNKREAKTLQAICKFISVYKLQINLNRCKSMQTSLRL